MLTQQPADTIRNRQLDEVVVESQTASRRVNTVDMGIERFSASELTAAPQLLGEPDVARSLQLLPGVKHESEASSGIQVRGGTSAQNAIFYDGVPVYNIGHLAGLFSAFNSDALSTVTLYKGSAPARYGGGSSAVLDIGSRAASSQSWCGSATIGLLSAKALAEGAIGQRGTLLVGARRSYADVPMQLFDDFKGNTLYFYDVNARADYRLTDDDQLRLSLFASRDRTALKDLASMEWSNLAVSMNWIHHYGIGSHGSTSLLLSDYRTRNAISLLGMDHRIQGHIFQWGLNHVYSFRLGNQQLNTGIESKVVEVLTGEWQVVTEHKREQRRAWQNAIWAGAELNVSNCLTAQAGLRMELFSSLGGPYYYETDAKGDIVWFYRTRRYHIVNTHLTLDPRLGIKWQVNPLLSVKASYGHGTQHLHALRGQATSTPFDRYMLSSNIVKPQQSRQISAGVFAMTPDQDYDVSLEGYYRSISNILDYRNGKSYGSAIEMERLVLPGKGRCYGGELMVRKNSGRLTGWIAYTLAWAKNKIDGINDGRWYTASTDRRHDIDVVAMYRLNDEWKLSALWVYNSGQAFTAPSGKYEIIDNYIYYYAERNGYRAPAYHRLDVGASWTKPIARGRFTRELQFGIYNLYNRYNPFIINFEDSDQGARTKAIGYSLFGIVPSVSLTITF